MHHNNAVVGKSLHLPFFRIAHKEDHSEKNTILLHFYGISYVATLHIDTAFERIRYRKRLLHCIDGIG